MMELCKFGIPWILYYNFKLYKDQQIKDKPGVEDMEVHFTIGYGTVDSLREIRNMAKRIIYWFVTEDINMKLVHQSNSKRADPQTKVHTRISMTKTFEDGWQWSNFFLTVVKSSTVWIEKERIQYGSLAPRRQARSNAYSLSSLTPDAFIL